VRRVIATHDGLDLKAFVEIEEGDYRVATRWTPARVLPRTAVACVGTALARERSAGDPATPTAARVDTGGPSADPAASHLTLSTPPANAAAPPVFSGAASPRKSTARTIFFAAPAVFAAAAARTADAPETSCTAAAPESGACANSSRLPRVKIARTRRFGEESRSDHA